jgi:hypothetical protein
MKLTSVERFGRSQLISSVGHGEYEDMKRFLTRILLVAVLAACLFGLWYFTLSPRAHVTRAVRAIAEAEAAIGEASLDPFKMKAPVRQYCTALRSVPLNGCPRDFAVAHIEYVRAWEDILAWAEKNDGWVGRTRAGWQGFQKGFVFDLNMDTMPMMVEIQKLEDTRKATQRNLEDAALKYGVTFQ